MKLLTKKAERRQAEEQRQQIVRAANYGYTVGLNTAMDIVYVSIGSALIAATIANTIVDQSYKRSILKLSQTDFNIDKTIVHMSKKMAGITGIGNDKGYKKFTKFLFECNKEGFDFWNPDVSRMVLNIGFDNYRDHIGEMGIIVSKLDGKGSDLIKKSFDQWKKYGSNVFPFGPASGWKDLLVKDYELSRNITKINVILNSIKSGTITEADVESVNTLFGLIEAEYAGSTNQMHAQSTENCAAYRNAQHFVEQICELLERVLSKLGVEFRVNRKQLRIKRIDSSVVQEIKSSRIEAVKYKKGLFNFIFGKGRTVKPPKEGEPAPKKKSKKRQDEEDDEFGDDFFDEDDEEETPEDEEKELKAAKSITDLAVGLKRAKTVSQKKRLSKNLHNLITKYCDDFKVTEEEFLNAYPEVKEVF